MSRFALLAGLVAASSFAAEPGTDEPPAAYFFEAGGKLVPIELDKPFDPRALGDKPVTLRVGPNRKFAYGNVEFLFPRSYTFEASVKARLSTWTLSGNDCKLMVHHYAVVADVDELRKTVVSSLVKSLGKEGSNEGEARLEVQGMKVSGVRLEFKIATSRISQEIFTFRSGLGAVMLIIQDSPTDSGGPSVERVEAGKLLAQSFKPPK